MVRKAVVTKTEIKPKRVRRTAEQRLADLEQKQLEIMERQKAAIEKIEAQKQLLLNNPSSRKERLEREKRFQRTLLALVPEWDLRHVTAAVAISMAEDMDRLCEQGEKLLEEHGKARRGRRAKAHL